MRTLATAELEAFWRKASRHPERECRQNAGHYVLRGYTGGYLLSVILVSYVICVIYLEMLRKIKLFHLGTNVFIKNKNVLS